MVCVLCEVRTEVLYVIHTNFILQIFINYICNGIIFALKLLSTSQNSFQDTKPAFSFLSVGQAFHSQVHWSTLLHFKYSSMLWKSILVDDFLVTNFTLDKTVARKKQNSFKAMSRN